jgi:DNA-binding MarR family transcriptional regulator
MTQSARWFSDVVDEIFTGMGARTNASFEQFSSELGGIEGRDLLLMQLAYGFAPEPITPDFTIKRAPYTNPETHRQEMAETAERGWLEAVGDGQFKLSAQGRDAGERLFALFGETYANFESLPDADLDRIAALLHKVVEKAKALPEPAEKWALSWGEKFDRGPSAPLTIQVRRRLIDLVAFRDDAHVGAWQPYNVSGQEWEALTFVWRDEANTAAELAEKLPSRGYDEDAYAAALKALADRGWLAKEGDKYVATEKGKKLRQEAEETTDRYFDAAWATLSDAKMEEVKGLLEKLAEAVKPPEEEE